MADAIQSGVRLEFFGGPVVRGVGTVRALSPTQELLLVLVWGHERPGISRQRAIWLLWEDDDDAPARHRLRQLLSQLRMRLGLGRDFLAGEDVLRADPATTSDLADFRSALRGGDIAAGANLVAKGFAPRIRKLPGPQFEHWLQGKRAGLERDLRAAGLRFWDQGRAMGDWRVALDAAEALLAVEPQAEAALRKVIEARAMTGSLQEAERTVEEFLARKPASYVLEAKTVAQLDRARRTMVKDGAGNDTGPDSPPLVGRTDALETARQVLRRVTDGRFAFLLIRGEAGIGKTRLLEEVRREAGLLGARCLHARPVELEQRIPLNPLIDALDDRSVLAHIETLEHPWKAVVGSVLPRLTSGLELPAVPRIAESSLSRRLYDAFSILFTEIAAEKPTFLFIDDLQWADDTTIAVLQFMQRRWTSGPFGVIAAVRPDLVTGSEGVAKYLADNRKLEVTDIVLRDLEEADALRLLDLISDGRLDRTVRDRLCALGGRNPFYLIELTRDYLKGRLELPELPNEVPEIPISLRQLVDPRIARLTEGAASLAALLSVWGRWIPMVELARLAGEAIEECARQVEELEVLRLATLERSRVRIAHELFRGAIYHSLSEARRSALHHRVAEHLLSTESPLATELAIHFARAGDPTQAARYGREAADEAMDSGAMAEAAHFLEVVADSVTDPRLKAEATADLAQVLHMNREIARADPMLELAASRLRLTGNHRRALRMDIRRVEGLAELGTATMSHLLDRLETTKASARDADDWEVLALALDCELHLLHRSGRVSEIRNLFHEVRECAEKGGPQAACVANGSLALDILFGDGSLALSAGRAAVDLAKKTPECEEHLLRAQSRLALVLNYAGLLHSEEGLQLLRDASVHAETSGELTRRFYLESNRGVYLMDIGELDAAEAAFDKAAPILERTVPGTPHLNLLCNRGELYVQKHNYEKALSCFSAAEGFPSSNAPTYLRELTNAGLGVCYLELGSLSDAREREAQLTSAPEHWCFDPSLICEFRARLLSRRGRFDAAIKLVHAAADAVYPRLITAWIKLVMLEARLRIRARCGGVESLSQALKITRHLGLSTRTRELENLYSRLGRAPTNRDS